MDRLVCPCLNVSVSCIHSNGGWKSRPTKVQRLFPEVSRDRLVTGHCPLYEVDLDVAGVFAEHQVLVVCRLAGDWNIHTCSNCDTDVYVTHTHKEEGGRVFVTGKLLEDPDAVATARKKERYSRVFKIVLHSIAEEDSEMFRRRRVSSMSFGREDPVMKVAHSRMKSYLNKEQEEMEERVRLYEAQQREAFAQLQQRAHDDRSLLFAAIAKARENVISDAMNEVTESFSKALTKSMTSEHTSTQPDVVVKKKGQRSPTHLPPPTQRTVTVTLKDLPRTEVPPKQPAVADNEMFLLDGFDDDQLYANEQVDGGQERGNPLAFPQSDDEEISTDDSSYRDVSALAQVGIASSVPVSVPMFPTQPVNTNISEQLSSSVSEGFDPAELGDTIRQLALSVQDTGMFGDLPRPRMMGPRGR